GLREVHDERPKTISGRRHIGPNTIPRCAAGCEFRSSPEPWGRRVRRRRLCRRSLVAGGSEPSEGSEVGVGRANRGMNFALMAGITAGEVRERALLARRRLSE